MEKKMFLFYTSWRKNVDMMNDEELRRFITNLCNYAEGYEVETPTRIEQMIWNDVVELLNHNETKRQKTIEKRRIAGLKGGAPVGNTNAQKKTNVDETNINNQMVEIQPKQPDICNRKKDVGYMLKEEGNMICVEGNMLKEEGNTKIDINNKILEIMKQVIEDGLIKEVEVRNWKINNTREILNETLFNYPNWESDLLKLGLDSFLINVHNKTDVEVDYILYSTLKAHLYL